MPAGSLFVNRRRRRRDNYYHSKNVGRVRWLLSVGRSIQALNFLHSASVIVPGFLLRPCWRPCR
jgi:hypothetical protein